jgi:membrane-associated phospholipid phosphatase
MIRKLIWVAVFGVIAVALTILIARIPYVPGDVETTRALQAAAPADMRWAEWLSAGGRWPWLLIPVAVSFLLSFYLGGLRASIGAIGSIAAVWFLDKLLHHLVFQPRPSADLIHVVPPPAHGSAFPSTVALIYVGAFGYLATVAALRAGKAVRWLVAGGCIALLASVGTARIVLGAHWPSDILLSYLYGFIVAAMLITLVPRRRR